MGYQNEVPVRAQYKLKASNLRVWIEVLVQNPLIMSEIGVGFVGI